MLQIVKANIMQHKLEKTKEGLEDALPAAQALKNARLIEFVETCLNYTDKDMDKKQSMIASRSSRTSGFSSNMSRASSIDRL